MNTAYVSLLGAEDYSESFGQENTSPVGRRLPVLFQIIMASLQDCESFCCTLSSVLIV